MFSPYPSNSIFAVRSFYSLTFIFLINTAMLGQNCDPDWSLGAGVNATGATAIFDIEENQNGNYYVCGTFEAANGQQRYNIAEYMPDGKITSFNLVGVDGPSIIGFYDMTVQPDGQIIVVGRFSFTAGPNTYTNIFRMKPDGSLDSEFNPRLTWPTTVRYIRAVELLSDDRIVVGGNFNAVQSNGNGMVERNGIAILNRTQGDLDESFDPGLGIEVNKAESIYDLAINKDDEIIAAGDFADFNKGGFQNIVKLKMDGNFANWNPTIYDGPILVSHLNDDNSVLVGGQFTEVNGKPQPLMIKLEPEGAPDPGFDMGAGFEGSMVTSIRTFEDGTIIAGGNFDNYNKRPHLNIVAMRGDGLDLELSAGSSTDNTIWEVYPVLDGALLDFFIGGQFTSFNCKDAPRLKRLELKEPDSPAINMVTAVAGTLCENELVNAAWNVNTADFCTNNTFSLELSSATGSFASPTVLASLQTNKSSSVEGGLPSGLPYGTNYRVRISSSDPPGNSTSSSPFTIEPSNPTWSLSGPSTICPDDNGVQFTATNVPSASFNWTYPTSGAVVGSDTSNALTLDFNNFSGPFNVSVNISTECNSITRNSTLNSYPNPSYSAGTAVTGNMTLCENDNEPYSVDPLTNVSNYVWTVPADAVITSGQGTRFITVDWTGSAGGSLNLTGFNACGESGNTIKNTVNVNPMPSQSEIQGPIEDTVYLCDTKEINLKGSAPGPGEVGSWRPLGLDDISSSPSLTVPLTSGLQGYSWLHRFSSSGCTTYDTVIIVQSSADAGGEYTFCNFMTSTYVNGSALEPGFETGQWDVLSGTGSFNIPTIPSTLAFSGGGKKSVVSWSVTNQACTSVDQTIVWFDTDNDLGNDISICGDTYQLNALELNPSSSGTWDVVSGNGAFDNENATSAEVSGLSEGFNILRWTVTNTACSETVADSIIVESKKEITPFTDVVNNAATICDGELGNFDLDDYWQIYGSPEFQWYVNGSPTAGANGLNFQPSGLNDGDQIHVRLIQNYECSTSDTVFSSQESVDVNPNLTPSLNLTLFGSNTICLGDLVSLQVDGLVNEGASPSFQWYLNSSPLTGVSGQSHETASLQDGDQIYVEMTVSSEICTNTPVVQSSVITFTVNEVPASTNPIAGNSQPCIGGTETYATTSVSGAQDYQWTVPTGASLLSDTSGLNTTSIDVDFGSATSGTVRVRAINNCGVGPVEGVVLSFQDVPSGLVSITSADTVCVNAPTAVSTSTLAEASSYFWTVPSGFSIISGQSSSSINTSAITSSGGTISVTPRNICGDGTTIFAPIESIDAPTETGVISGPQTVCEGATELYSTSPITGATSYLWSLPPDGFTSSQAASANITLSDQSGNVSVAGVNMCGTGPITDHAVTVNLEPADAGALSGAVSVCAGSTGLTYSIATVPNTTNYQWDVIGGVLVGGAGTSSILIDAATTDISLSVTPENSCGEGNVSNLAVTVENVPVITIGGNGNPNCYATGETYSLSPNSLGSTYNWTVPNGATFSGQGSANISVDFGASNGFVTAQETTASGCVGVAEDLQISLTGCALSADFQIVDDTVCVGEPVTITNLSTGTSTSSSFLWDFGVNSTPATSSQELPSDITYSTSGSKEVSLTVTEGISEVKILPDAVTVFDFPSTPLIVGEDTVCSGEAGVAFSVPGGTVGSNYTWSVPTGAAITSGQGTASIVVDFGSASGFVTVTETNIGGCQSSQGTLEVQIRTVPDPAGAVLGPVGPCETDTVTYQVSPVNGATSYLWSLPSGSTIAGFNSGESIDVVVGPTAGNVQVTPINQCGNGTAASRSITPSNVPNSAGVVSGVDSICSGSSDQNYSIPTVAGATGYTWNLPSGSSLANGTNTNSVSVNFGNIEGAIEVIPFNACGNATSSSLDISFIPLPTIGSIVGQNQVCENESGVNYTIENALDYSSIVWSVPSGATISNQGSETISVDFGVESGDVAVNVTNVCGAASEVYTVAVTGSVTPSVVISSLSDTVCTGEPNTFTALASGGGTSPLFEWYGDGSIIQTSSSSSSLVVDNVSQYAQIKVELTSSITCTVDPLAFDSVVVNSYENVGTITPINGVSSFCASADEGYSIASVDGAINYEWNVPSGLNITSGSGTESITLSASIADTFELYVSAFGQCDTVVSPLFEIVVLDVPAIAGIGGPDTVCANLTGVIYNAFGITGIVDSINWTALNAAQSTKNVSGDQLTVDFASDSVQFTVTAYNSCGASTPVNSTTHIGTSFGVPVTVTPATTFCEGDTAELILNGFGNAFDKIWYKNGVDLLLSDKDTTLLVTESGDYQVDVTSNGCSGQSAVITMTTTTISQVSLGIDTVICSASGVLTASPVGDVYSWDLDGAFVSSGSVNTLMIATSGYYEVTATNAFGCSSLAGIEVLVNPQLSPLAGDVTIFHADNLNLSLVLSDELSDFDSITVQLLGAPVHGQLDENLLKNEYVLDYQPNVQFSGKDKVTYIISNKCGITDTVDVTINVRPKAIVGTTDISTSGVVKLSWATLLENDEGTILAATVTITRIASGAAYSVEGEDIEIDYAGIDYTQEFDTLYYIFVDPDGLQSEESYHLLKLSNPEVIQTHEPDGRITIYNAVSANGDEIQSYFSIPAFDPVNDSEELYPDAKVTIWDSWGQEVFSSTNYGFGQEVWDGGYESGNLLPEGTYFYSVQLATESKPSRRGYLILKH